MSDLILRTVQKRGSERHILEVFKTKESYILHKHLWLNEDDYNSWMKLEEENNKLKVFQEVRKFWGKYYCTQWLFISHEEYKYLQLT